MPVALATESHTRTLSATAKRHEGLAIIAAIVAQRICPRKLVTHDGEAP
jgi:hypothetical protein